MGAWNKEISVRMKTMENADKITVEEDSSLNAFASQLAARLGPVRPNYYFREALKARLTRSKIFSRRRAAGAISVGWLSAALVVVIIAEIIYAAAGGCQKQKRAGA